MGWAILLLLAGATLAALLLVARPGRGAIELVAAVLLLALAGYAWQGRPGLPGHPTPPRAAGQPEESLFARERGQWLERMGRDAQVLDTADGFIRNGDPDYAIGILRGAISRDPKRMMLWLGLANALVTYADGTVTLPARFAFDRAQALAPADPAPAYFMGLAYAASGDLETAQRIWRDLALRAPEDADWRLRVGAKLMLLDRLRAAMPAR